MMRSFIKCTLYQSYYGDRMKEDGIGGVCSTRGKMRKAFKIFVGKLQR